MKTLFYKSKSPTKKCTRSGPVPVIQLTFLVVKTLLQPHMLRTQQFWLCPINATNLLQTSLNEIATWAKKWEIKINSNKSTHVIATRCLDSRSEAKQCHTKHKGLGEIFRHAFRQKAHMETAKGKQVDLKMRKLYRIFGRKSPLTLDNKLLLSLYF